MEWIYLLLAGVSEVTWATAMKFSHGFSRVVPSVVTVVFYIVSALFLSLAQKKLPLGMAYAMWAGFGIVGTTVLGIFLFHESLSAAQWICLAMITAGIVGMKLIGS